MNCRQLSIKTVSTKNCLGIAEVILYCLKKMKVINSKQTVRNKYANV